MTTRVRAILRPEPNFWWTVGGAVPILWNASHWRRGPHVSGLARKHPLVTCLVMGAYLYHFIGPEKRKQLVETIASSAADGLELLEPSGSG